MAQAPGAAPAGMWRWVTPEAQQILATRNLGVILRYYRQQYRLSQTALGELLGYDKTYVSLLESGKRAIDDIASLRRIADALRLPPHVLGVTDSSDTDVAAMLQFGTSTLRLAEIARQSGHATAAVDELWPLVARLEGRVSDGHSEREVLQLLARARTGLGVALGHVLPEERLATAARWTGKGLSVARRLDDRGLHVVALRMHGNELRKAGFTGPALDRLRHAVQVSRSDEERAAALPLLARAAGEAGATRLFDEAIRSASHLLESGVGHTSLFNPYALHEIHIRGLVTTERARTAVDRLEHAPTAGAQSTPQWRVISHITIGGVLLRQGDRTAAEQCFGRAVMEAADHRLPHQLQRILREAGDLALIRDDAGEALVRLRAELAA
jgi:transcriptional regulator with XRE-family HTH domain